MAPVLWMSSLMQTAFFLRAKGLQSRVEEEGHCTAHGQGPCSLGEARAGGPGLHSLVLVEQPECILCCKILEMDQNGLPVALLQRLDALLDKRVVSWAPNPPPPQTCKAIDTSRNIEEAMNRSRSKGGG